MVKGKYVPPEPIIPIEHRKIRFSSESSASSFESENRRSLVGRIKDKFRNKQKKPPQINIGSVLHQDGRGRQREAQRQNIRDLIKIMLHPSAQVIASLNSSEVNKTKEATILFIHDTGVGSTVLNQCFI